MNRIGQYLENVPNISVNHVSDFPFNLSRNHARKIVNKVGAIGYTITNFSFISPLVLMQMMSRKATFS